MPVSYTHLKLRWMIRAYSAVGCNPQFFLFARVFNRFWYHRKALHAKSKRHSAGEISLLPLASREPLA